MTILGWYENLQEEEIPPKRLWLNGKGLERHFKQLKEKWKGKHSEEAPEGTLDDAKMGHDVTLRNKLLDDWLKAASDDNDYDEL